jgi:hypothetical protein
MPHADGGGPRRPANGANPLAVRARSLAVVARRFLDGLVAFCRALHPSLGTLDIVRGPLQTSARLDGFVSAAGPLTDDFFPKCGAAYEAAADAAFHHRPTVVARLIRRWHVSLVPLCDL